MCCIVVRSMRFTAHFLFGHNRRGSEYGNGLETYSATPRREDIYRITNKDEETFDVVKGFRGEWPRMGANFWRDLKATLEARQTLEGIYEKVSVCAL